MADNQLPAQVQDKADVKPEDALAARGGQVTTEVNRLEGAIACKKEAEDEDPGDVPQFSAAPLTPKKNFKQSMKNPTETGEQEQ